MTNNELIIKNQGFMGLTDFNISEGSSEELIGLDSGFELIKIPAGGGTMFEVPGSNQNEPDAVKEFSEVILYHPMFTVYREKYSDISTPPDCLSFDGVNGHGESGEFCQSCTKIIGLVTVLTVANLVKINIKGFA